MELVATRSAEFEPGRQQVHQPLGIPELLGGHPVEVAVADRLRAAVRVRRDRDDVGRRLVLVGVAVGRDGHPLPVLGQLGPFIAGHRAVLGCAVIRGHGLWSLFRAGRLEVRLEGPATPVLVEDTVVDRPIVASPGEDGRAGGADHPAVADVDDPEGAGKVNLRAEIDGQAGLPQRPPEADGTCQQAMSVDRLAGTARDDRGIAPFETHGHSLTGRGDETCARKVGVERERTPDPVARCERQGHPIHQARPAADPTVIREGRFVQRPVDHLDADRRQEVVNQGHDSCRTQTRADQGDTLHDHVRMGHEVLVVRIDPEGDRGRVMGIVPVE